MGARIIRKKYVRCGISAQKLGSVRTCLTDYDERGPSILVTSGGRAGEKVVGR